MTYKFYVLLILAINILFSEVCAQSKDYKTDINIEPDKTKLFKKYQNEEAVILYDICDFDVKKDSFTLKRTKRVKILNEEGLTNFSQLEIPFDAFNLVAAVENPDNTKSILKASNIVNEVEPGNEFIIINFPNIQVGSELLLEYSVARKGTNLPTWYFQNEIPTVFSEVTIKKPKKFTFHEKVNNMHNNISRRITNTSEHYFASRLPGLKNEKYISTVENHITKIEFGDECVSIYKNVAKNNVNLNAFFPKTILSKSNSMVVQNIKKQIGLNLTPSYSSLEAVVSYFHKNFDWNKQNTLFSKQDFNSLVNSKNGTSADLHWLFYQTVLDYGFEINPVYLKLRSSGELDRENYTAQDFDYMLTKVSLKGQDLLIDLTEPLLPMGFLPKKCLNKEFVVLKGKKLEWESIPVPVEYETVKNELRIDTDNFISGKIANKKYGYLGMEEKIALINNKKTSFESNLSNIVNEGSLSVDIEEGFVKKDSFNIHADYSKSLGESATVSIDPVFCEKYQTNPFVFTNRTIPVELTNFVDFSEKSIIHLPNNINVLNIPTSKELFFDFNHSIHYTYNVKKLSGNSYEVSTALKVDRLNFEVNELKKLELFFDQIIETQNQELTFKHLK